MPNKAIFFDRDDTLIKDYGYINSPDQVKLLDGVSQALIDFKNMGYKLVVVSNQSAVARGIVSEKTLIEINNRLQQLLKQKGAQLDNIYYCPFHPDGVIQKYRKDSNLRKPNPGMLLQAADEMDIDLGQSWMIGDKFRDVEAGLNAGCKTILLDNFSSSGQPGTMNVRPDYKAVNIKEAVNIIKQHNRSKQLADIPQQTTTPKEPQPQVFEEKIESENIETIAKPPVEPQRELEPEPKLQPQPEAEPEKQAEKEITEQLLTQILEQLKRNQRHDSFGDFSIMRMLAGLVQVVVFLCLVISIWFLMSPAAEDSSIITAIAFGIFFQLMALTFYIMQDRK